MLVACKGVVVCVSVYVVFTVYTLSLQFLIVTSSVFIIIQDLHLVPTLILKIGGFMSEGGREGVVGEYVFGCRRGGVLIPL